MKSYYFLQNGIYLLGVLDFGILDCGLDVGPELNNLFVHIT
jgi:hypothetical protein